MMKMVRKRKVRVRRMRENKIEINSGLNICTNYVRNKGFRFPFGLWFGFRASTIPQFRVSIMDITGKTLKQRLKGEVFGH